MPALIGGIRVVVGDEVLDTSVQGPSGTNESGAHCVSASGRLTKKEGKSHATQSRRNF
jgi:hypothetical protein